MLKYTASGVMTTRTFFVRYFCFSLVVAMYVPAYEESHIGFRDNLPGHTVWHSCRWSGGAPSVLSSLLFMEGYGQDAH